MQRRQTSAAITALLLPATWGATTIARADTSQADAASGIRAALERGSASAIALLGRPDGFLGNPKVRIPLPGFLESGAKLLRMSGQGARLDAQLARVHDEVAEPRFGGDEFGGDQHAKGQAPANAQARRDIRQAGRYGHIDEQFRSLEAHGLSRAQQRRVDAGHAFPGVGEDGEEGAQEYDKHLRRLAQAEPDDGHGNPRQRRHRTQHLDHRSHQVTQCAVPATGDRDGDAKKGAERKADEDALKAGPRVATEVGQRHAGERDGDRAGRRGKYGLAHQFAAGEKLPG